MNSPLPTPGQHHEQRRHDDQQRHRDDRRPAADPLVQPEHVAGGVTEHGEQLQRAGASSGSSDVRATIAGTSRSSDHPAAMKYHLRRDRPVKSDGCPTPSTLDPQRVTAVPHDHEGADGDQPGEQHEHTPASRPAPDTWPNVSATIQ